ncbi:ribose-5-phosphate isomerase RpiA [Maribacter flavus]|uniref:Ribose-5-phosphate isomerase A n=1 Tax=Maribacter flavus TaxID=1658664 RepID=A0A5B2TUA3_9FLAO|nr:ribose-5-phosphate isomerase RpiA [Maribacter flavus]KAA2217405.1 ribose-5-phosphate isomerase RpiA [Maribacter flavus]
MNLETEKRLAATEAVKFVKDGMTVGLGSGSTSAYMIRILGEKVENGLKIKGVPSSEKTAALAREMGIPLVSLDDVKRIDINLDGADEFDPQMRLIKGGGGALLREKIIAHNSKVNIIITDSSKQVERLGKFKLPVETIPFATNKIISELEDMGLKPIPRKANGALYVTDENNYIVDVDIWEHNDLETLGYNLIRIPGIVETGLFLNTADMIIMGKGDAVTVFQKK